jgi:hypothetical protein
MAQRVPFIVAELGRDADPSPLAWPQASCLIWPRPRPSRYRKIPGETLAISSRKPKRSLGGLPDDLPIKLSRIACRRTDGLPIIGVAKTVGVGVGSAGGIVAAVGAGGDGDR